MLCKFVVLTLARCIFVKQRGLCQSEVTSTSLPFKGQVTKQTTVKWSISEEQAIPTLPLSHQGRGIKDLPHRSAGEYSVETHLIDFEDDLVNAHLEVCFYERMRGQVAFDSPETLKGQIARDIAAARRWHEENKL